MLSWLAAVLLVLGFRRFQRASGLPDAAAALFAWFPYLFSLSWCLPKIETAGYGLVYLGLGLALGGGPRRAALLLGAAFWVHTGAALYGLWLGGTLALARRDRQLATALLVAVVGALPLVAVHMAAGCSLAQALLFSRGDYLRSPTGAGSFAAWRHVLALAGPPLLLAAALGAPALWRQHRAIAWGAVAALALWANELWLAPLGQRTTLNLLRGLTVLAFPVAAAAGCWSSARPARSHALAALAAAWSLGCVVWALPGACHRAPVDPDRVSQIVVDRCQFRWGAPAAPR